MIWRGKEVSSPIELVLGNPRILFKKMRNLVKEEPGSVKRLRDVYP